MSQISSSKSAADSPQSAHYADVAVSLEFVKNHREFRDLNGMEGVIWDLRYGNTNNFIGRNLYGPHQFTYLHAIAAEKLDRAVKILQTRKPGWQILALDFLRPRSVQRVLWDAVKGTSEEAYVADPAMGSIHNYGLAVDLSLANEEGSEVDMGTPFDFFGALAEPQHEEKFLRDGQLTVEQVENRRLLRAVMTVSGFIPIRNEWWHFDALPGDQTRGSHVIVE